MVDSIQSTLSDIISIDRMSKRPASYDIDERTFEEKERSGAGTGQIEPEGAHMAGRK